MFRNAHTVKPEPYATIAAGHTYKKASVAHVLAGRMAYSLRV
jgi:hypothetical protein